MPHTTMIPLPPATRKHDHRRSDEMLKKNNAFERDLYLRPLYPQLSKEYDVTDLATQKDSKSLMQTILKVSTISLLIVSALGTSGCATAGRDGAADAVYPPTQVIQPPSPMQQLFRGIAQMQVETMEREREMKRRQAELGNQEARQWLLQNSAAIDGMRKIYDDKAAAEDRTLAPQTQAPGNFSL